MATLTASVKILRPVDFSAGFFYLKFEIWNCVLQKNPLLRGAKSNFYENHFNFIKMKKNFENTSGASLS